MDISVHLLAGVRVVRDGRVRPVTSRRQRAIVAALALSLGRSVSEEQLIDALWGEDSPDGARPTLQSYVSRLRSALGDGAVVHGPAGYRLADGATSDVMLVQRLANEGREAMRARPVQAFESAQRALALWEGASLAEFAENAWFVPAASGLDELRANLLDLAGEALTAAGRSVEAVELLEPVARSDPLREPSHVRLVDALRAAGRSVDAVRVANRYRHTLRDETGLEPGPDLLAAEQRALASADDRRLAAAPIGRKADGEWRSAVLPRPNRLIGRDRDLAGIVEALSSARLVTICGPGGVGKSRLVAELIASRTVGVASIVVELAPTQVGEVATAVAAVLRLRAERASPATIVERLRDVEAVVVVDNAEHVLEEVRMLARALLDRCGRLRLLVTSRTRLDLPDEHVHTLTPLATDGARSSAVELFTERLLQAGRTSMVNASDADLRAICTRLDGLPLALELAAGRAATLGVGALHERLGSGLDLLATVSNDDGRHASLERVISWSYDLLDDPSRRLVSVLAVFDGEFDLDAAEEVGSAVIGQPVSLMLARLVDASLLATTGTAGRYRLLGTIRQYGRERLTESGDAHRAPAVHVGWTARRLAQIAAILGPDEAEISPRLDALRDEIRGAIRWTRERGDASLAAALVPQLAGPLLYRPDAELIEAGRTLVERVLSRAAEPNVVAPELMAAGARLAFLAGDLGSVDRLADLAVDDANADSMSARHWATHARGVLRLYQGRHEEAATAFSAITDDDGAALPDRLDALGGLGLALCYADRHQDAQLVVDLHRAIADTVDSATYRAFADYVQAEIDLATADVQLATRHLRHAADRAWSVGATFVWGIAATVLAGVLVRDRPAEAGAHLAVLLERWRRSATWPQLWTTLRLVADLLADHGIDDVAALILLAADRDASAPHLAGDDLARDEALRMNLRHRLGDGRYTGIAIGVATLERAEVCDRALDAIRRLDS